jgi:hypothetical protein
MKKDITGNRSTAVQMIWPRHANGGLQNCWTGHRMRPKEEKEVQHRPVNTWKGMSMGSMQRRNHKDE